MNAAQLLHHYLAFTKLSQPTRHDRSLVRMAGLRHHSAVIYLCHAKKCEVKRSHVDRFIAEFTGITNLVDSEQSERLDHQRRTSAACHRPNSLTIVDEHQRKHTHASALSHTRKTLIRAQTDSQQNRNNNCVFCFVNQMYHSRH